MRTCRPYLGGLIGSCRREDQEHRNSEAGKARIRAEYQQILKNPVSFERRIREQWREKKREKSARLVELKTKVKELERRLVED